MPHSPTASGLLVQDHTVLLTRRSLHKKHYPNLWDYPGGHVEPGETLEQALIREMQEEVGVTPLTFSHFDSLADPHAPEVIHHTFLVTTWRGEPAICSDETSELAWFDLADAAAMTDLAIDDYRRYFRDLDRRIHPPQ